VNEQVIAATQQESLAAEDSLLTACETTGAVRPGLDPADVLLLMGFLWRVSDDEQGRAQADRTLDLVLQGPRPNASPALNPLR
jgi:hypothetical protein